MTGRFHIANLGCRANLSDGHVIHQDLVAEGWSPAADGDGADLVIINSCTVTDQADRDSARLAGRLRRRFPDAEIVMTGCGAEIAPDRMARVEAVDRVVGNQDKHRLTELLAEGGTGAVLGHVTPYPEMKPRHSPGRVWNAPTDAFPAPLEPGVRTRTFLKVQEGCDAFCTFCIIPYARGPGRSSRPSEVIKQVRAAIEGGAREVVLTGTALDTYGRDLGDALGFDTLVEAVLKETTIERLRLPSLDPLALSPQLRALMTRESRLCPHAHVALQSPHSGILKRMNRRYDAEAVEEALLGLEAVGATLAATRDLSGGVFVGMDVITGFPGETEAIFQWTLERLAALPWHRLHVFPYSERASTAATRLGGVVPPAERKRRVRALMALSLERLQGHYEQVLGQGRPLDVLVEGVKDGLAQGKTANYYRVRFPVQAATERNQWARVVPEGITVFPARGEVALDGAVLS
jgi:threonylcarbamoyladenosine tRNA methylthiotransferase MtaB